MVFEASSEWDCLKEFTVRRVERAWYWALRSCNQRKSRGENKDSVGHGMQNLSLSGSKE